MSAITFKNIEVRDPSLLQMCAAYRTFRVSSGATVIAAAAETPLLYINNPTANSVPLSVFLRKILDATTGHTCGFKFYSNPTVTVNGTVKTPTNLRVAAPANTAPASGAQVFQSPTVSANGVEIGSASAGNTDEFLNSPIMIDAGASLLVTATPSNAGDSVVCEVQYAEGV